MSITYRAETVFNNTLLCTEVRIVEITKMTAQKRSSPSFASIISVLSIVLYCAGFLRVELELKDQKKRINALENVADTKASSSDSDVIKVIENAQGRFVVLFM